MHSEVARPSRGFCAGGGVSGDTVVVGANGDDDNGFASGSAYVFIEPGGVQLPGRCRLGPRRDLA